MVKTLEQVLVDCREDAQVLRRRGIEREAELMDRLVSEVHDAAYEYLTFISEDDAMLRADRSRAWLRARFPAWSRQGNAKMSGRARWYRMVVVPHKFSDAEAFELGRQTARGPVTGNAHPRGNGVNPKAKTPAGWDTGDGSHRGKKGRYPRPRQNESFSAAVAGLVEERNARSVWTIQARPYPAAHFATFPPELASRCIKAGSRPGDTVLDPFGGSGTTAAVATGLGRNAIHVDLNPEYHELARDRIGPRLCDEVAS